MVDHINTLSWPLSRLNELIEILGRKSGLLPRRVDIPIQPEDIYEKNDEVLAQRIEAAARHFGLEAEPVSITYAEVEALLRYASPAFLCVPGAGEPRFLALLRGGWQKISLLGNDLAVHQIRLETVCALLCQELEAPITKEIERLIDEVGVPEKRQAAAKTVILRERLGQTQIDGGWLLRLPPESNFRHQVRQAGLLRRLVTLVGTHAIQYLLWILAWWIVGQGALSGRLDRGRLLAWAILLITLVPLRMLTTWLQGRLAIGAGGLLKQRLLQGVLRLESEEIRHQGAGQLLGRVIEAEAVESLALSGGFLSLVAVIELIMAAFVLGSGAGGWQHVFLLLGWIIFTLLMSWWYFSQRDAWTETRLEMTHDLVERMVGHRTRLAQETREHWHAGEDQALERYIGSSGIMDRTAAVLMTFVPRGWLILALLGLTPVFVSGRSTTAALAVGLGGMLLAYQALRELTAGLGQLAGAAIVWKKVAPIFHAAVRPEACGSLILTHNFDANGARDEQTIIDAHELIFRYRDRGEPVLRGCSLRVCRGQRLLLEGVSGGGKSTLASLLTGLRIPESGLLLLRGLDRQTIGTAEWHHRVAAAPQFHENHVLAETFAFNLLMGRRWPPRREDLQEAEAICHELGLGELLKRMPAGLQQMVGDTGWQLSHGERSRLYIARAILQAADLVVFDESFAALDPENLQRAMRCVLDRVPTVLVMAPP